MHDRVRSDLGPAGAGTILESDSPAATRQGFRKEGRDGMRIANVRAVPVSVPLTRPYHLSRGIMHAFPSVIVRLTTEDGLQGFGESVPLSVVGEVGPIADMLVGVVAEILVGRDPTDIEALGGEILAAVGGDLDVLGGVDLALWDILGKSVSLPVFRLMGGACNDPILVDYTLGAEDPAAMAARAQAMVDEGYTGVVVKVTGEVDMDIERTAAVRAKLGPQATIRVDCKAGYGLEDALRFLEGVKRLELEFVEQPVAADDLAGLRRCREVGVPISVDESLNSPAEALELVQERACDVFNIKVPKVGGLTFSKKIAAIAEGAGIPVVVGGRTTLELSRYASRHFAASTPATRGRAHEGPGPASQALADDIVAVRTTRDGLKAHNGCVPVETGPGLGADLLWDMVEAFALR
jgi:L-alanine-DL-glutamate epimerase-like enolase superfamily enzyme